MPRTTLTQVGKPYPFLPVKFKLHHVYTGEVMDLEETFYVDTGFSEYLLLPKEYLSRLRSGTGLEGTPRQREAISGPVVSLLFSGGEVTEISGYNLSNPIPIVIDCCGVGSKLFGRKLLDRWIAEFDGPKKLLSLLAE